MEEGLEALDLCWGGKCSYVKLFDSDDTEDEEEKEKEEANTNEAATPPLDNESVFKALSSAPNPQIPKSVPVSAFYAEGSKQHDRDVQVVRGFNLQTISPTLDNAVNPAIGTGPMPKLIELQDKEQTQTQTKRKRAQDDERLSGQERNIAVEVSAWPLQKKQREHGWGNTNKDWETKYLDKHGADARPGILRFFPTLSKTALEKQSLSENERVELNSELQCNITQNKMWNNSVWALMTDENIGRPLKVAYERMDRYKKTVNCFKSREVKAKTSAKSRDKLRAQNVELAKFKKENKELKICNEDLRKKMEELQNRVKELEGISIMDRKNPVYF